MKTSEKQFFNDFYSQKPRAYEDVPIMEKQARLYFSKMIKLLKPQKKDTVLSLGCAEGRFELRFAPHLKGITGLDLSWKGINLAKNKAKKLKIKNADFLVQDITHRLPFKDRSFEGVLALGIFHHIEIEKLAPLLQEINRVLKNNGFLYTIDPNANGILRIIGRNFFKNIYQTRRSPEEHDLDHNHLANLCLKTGFEIEKKEFLDFCLAETAWLWPNLPSAVFEIIYLLDRTWCQTPFINQFGAQFSLLCRKRK